MHETVGERQRTKILFFGHGVLGSAVVVCMRVMRGGARNHKHKHWSIVSRECPRAVKGTLRDVAGKGAMGSGGDEHYARVH